MTADRHGLRSVVRAAFGSGSRLVTVTRLAGGSKKGVYRLDLADGRAAAAYIWHPGENYWLTPGAAPGRADRDDVLADASGIGLFEAARAQLDAAGVATPRVYFADRSQRLYPADIALVEYLPGGTLEARLREDPQAAEASVARLGWTLGAMRKIRSARLGRPGGSATAAAGAGPRPEQLVLHRAHRQLAEAAGRVEQIAAARTRLAGLLDTLSAAISPRQEYSLVHGELGPDHVLVGAHGQPVLVDIEGTMFFDPEWEHVFLRLRFGRHYRWLQDSDLDERRLRLYSLALSLSLVAGPLRLLDGDCPDRAEFAAIVRSNIARTLSFIR